MCSNDGEMKGIGIHKPRHNITESQKREQFSMTDNEEKRVQTPCCMKRNFSDPTKIYYAEDNKGKRKVQKNTELKKDGSQRSMFTGVSNISKILPQKNTVKDTTNDSELELEF